MKMEVEHWESSSGGTSDSEVCVQDTNDEDLFFTPGDIPKRQFRKNISMALWDNEMGMAEVVEIKGKMWRTTGVVRGSKFYCSIEETLFLAEEGKLRLSYGDKSSVSLKEIYKKLAEGKNGCCLESFEVYKHLKSLGYIVQRHGVPWIMKSGKNKSASLEGMPDIKHVMDENLDNSDVINDLFDSMEITEGTLLFDVYYPNSKFGKSSPGNPSFVLCVTSGHPPSRREIENLERRTNGVPLKFGHVEWGRVSLFAFNRVEVPVLP